MASTVQRRWRWAALAGLNLAADQRKAAHELLQATVSQLGYDKATTIMGLESILRDLENARTDLPVRNIRDPERYYFTVFGTPLT